MTSKEIEEGAILAVKNFIQGSEIISQHISENDKEPFWDGALYLYAKPNKAKDSFMGRAPVQLEGQEVDKFKKKKYKYNISVKDLKAYLNDPTIYIVCQEKNKGRDSLLFYRNLLPETIKNILKGKDKQSTVSVAMKPMPKTLEDFEDIVKTFLVNSKKQVSFAKMKSFTLEDMKKRNIKNFSFVVPSSEMSPVEMMGYLSSHNSYMYAQIDKDLDIEIPIAEEIESVSFQSVIKKEVAVGDKIFFKEYRNEIKEGRLVISIGDILTLSILLNSKKHDNKASFKSTLKTLDKSIRDAEFVLALNEYGSLKIGDLSLHMKINEKDLVKDLKDRLDGWNHLKNVLHRFHVKKSLDLTAITEKQNVNINSILYSADTGNLVNIGHRENTLILVDIGNLNILLWESVDDKGNSRFGDFFDGKISLQYKFKDGKKYPVSPFSYLQNESLWLKCDNIPFENQISSYDILIDRNPHILEMANFDLLYMLECYDKLSDADSLRKYELLEYAEKLSCWLMRKETSRSLDAMHYINHCQVLKRLGKLGETEMSKLQTILLNEQANSILKVGASLLLEDKKEFRKWYPLCSKEDSENIKRFPIWRFFNNTFSKEVLS